MPETSHPSGDKRFKLLDVAIKRHRFQADTLIEVLHKAQELFGYLEEDLLFYVARGLKLPPSRVYGVIALTRRAAADTPPASADTRPRPRTPPGS